MTRAMARPSKALPSTAAELVAHLRSEIEQALAERLSG
jgi:hypothetical protein